MADSIILKAEFDPKLKIYWYFHGIVAHFALVFTGIGLFTLPLWMVFGLFVVSKRYDALSAELGERSIQLRSGVLFRVEKTIPLEKIQDLSLRTGPLLSAFGLASVQVETASGGAQQGSDMALPGLSNAEAFRNAVLAQRDLRSDGPVGAPSAAAAPDGQTLAVLEDIRDSLLRIEAALSQRGPGGSA